MTTAALIVTVTSAASLAGASAMMGEAIAAEPWWMAAVVVPLAGCSAWLVRWILQKQDARDSVTALREQKREEREEKRAEHADLQTRALQECVIELRSLNQQQSEHGKAIGEIPLRVVSLLEKGKCP